MGTFVIQPHTRLQEWVAEEHGYYAEEGLEYEFQADGFAGTSLTTSAVQSADGAPRELLSGAFEDMKRGRTCDVSSACHWAVNGAASEGAGRMWGHAYSVSPSGIFVAPDSPLRTPEDLADVPIAVGYHSGSHYSAIQALEPFLDRSDIKQTFSGLPDDRVRLMLRRDVQAANVFGAQYYVLEQLGYRKIVDSTFVMGFLLPATADLEDSKKYFRALEKAQRDIDLQPERYKKYWLRELPEDLAQLVDVRRFGPGERIVFQPYTREMFEVTQRWMQRWDLLDVDVNPETSFEQAVLV